MKKKLSVIILALVMALMTPLVVSAMTTEEDPNGVLAQQSTDKDSYGAEEKITTTLKVTNNSGGVIKNVKLANQTPTGYHLVSGEKDQATFDTVDAGKSVTLVTVFAPNQGTDTPGTGDNGRLMLYIVIGLASAAAIAALFASKKVRKYLLKTFVFLLLVGAGIAISAKGISAADGQPGTLKLTTQVTAAGKELSVNSTVDYEKGPWTFEAPTAKTGLKFNGGEQELVSAGTVSGATMKYRVGETGEFSADIPKATDAGTYKVYFMIEGDDYHEEYIDETGAQVTIGKYSLANATIAEVPDQVFKGSAITPTPEVTVPLAGGLKLTAGTDFDFSYDDNDAAGTATIIATAKAGSNYEGSKALTFDIVNETYTITYKDQGDVAFSGTHESGAPTSHTYGTATALKGASKTDYSFGGWFTTSDCSGTAITSLGATAYTEDITLYAKWKSYNIKVTYDLNGGKTWTTVPALGNPAPAKYGTAYGTLPVGKWSNSISENGYTFKGWSLAKTGGDLITEDTIITNPDDHSVYAQWEADTVELTLDANGGTVDGKDKSVKNVIFDQPYGDALDPAKTPVERTGYDFLGWFQSDTPTSKQWTSDMKVPAAYAHTFVARWQARTYTISVKDAGANGGFEFSGVLPEGFPTTHTYGKETAIGEPTRYGYDFEGWFTDAACTGSAITGLSADGFTSDITLYAKWEPIKATVTFDKNGGLGTTMKEQVFIAGEENALTDCTYTPADGDTQAFLGWNSAADGSGTAYENGQVTTFLEDTTLYAQWIAPLRFVAAADNSGFSVAMVDEAPAKMPEFVYSLNNGLNWEDLTFEEPVSLSKDDVAFVRAKTANDTLAVLERDTEYHINFRVEGSVGAHGNVMSLLDSTCKLDEVPEYGMYCLFEDCMITSAPDLPATTLNEGSYQMMFDSCTKLTTTAKMDASNLATLCCQGMYADCTGITNAGTLPATTMANSCYRQMFLGCTGLKKAPVLPATTLASDCYDAMFMQSGLTSAPELPVTNLKSSCYAYMFFGCENLATAPVLPATTMEESCYLGMFIDCPSLKTAPALPATKLADGCYSSMFAAYLGTPGLVTGPNLPATELAEGCYKSMFAGCRSLTKVGTLSAKTMAKESCMQMFQNCSALSNAPTLQSDLVMAEKCCYQMFENTGITKAPAVKAASMAEYCCCRMFNGCSNLKTAGDVSAPAMAKGSCDNMFRACYALTGAPALSCTELAEGCYNGMFYRCYALVNAPTLPATTLVTGCYSEMFNDCRSLESITVGFSDWGTNDEYTYRWMIFVPKVESKDDKPRYFNGPMSLSETPQGDSTIQEGWTFVPSTSETLPDYSAENGYMVCVWDILGDDEIVFGPATGSSSSCLKVNGNHEHCIAKDSWETIVKNLDEGHAAYYDDCLEAGCTHNVEITGNSVFSAADAQYSVLYTSIGSDYRRWNYAYSTTDCESANYATSMIRATLNGYNGMGGEFMPSTYAGTACLTKDNCLLSCFPEVLQDNIVAKVYNVPTMWNTNSYMIDNQTAVSDKLWLANAAEIYGTSANAAYVDYGTQLYKNVLNGVTTSNFEDNNAYSENGNAQAIWLRSPARSYRYYATVIGSTGGCSSVYVNATGYGISPFFILD